jgi:hypothetical protein
LDMPFILVDKFHRWIICPWRHYLNKTEKLI